jgi:hypothetical protein
VEGERKQLIDQEVWKVAKAISTDKRPGLEEWIVEMGNRLPVAANQNPLLSKLRNVSQIRILPRDPFASTISDFAKITKLDISEVPTVVLDVLMVRDVFRIGFLFGEGEYSIRVPNIEPITLEILDSTVSRKVTTLIVPSGEYGEISVQSDPIRIRTIDGRIYLIDPKLFKMQETVGDASAYHGLKDMLKVHELSLGRDQLTQEKHEIEAEAYFVLKAWLDAGGDKELVHDSIKAWLEKHEIETEAGFVLKAWLDAGGDKELVHDSIKAWLEKHEIEAEAYFILKSWLDVGGDKELVHDSIKAWLEKHEIEAEAGFVFQAWLDAGGDKELVHDSTVGRCSAKKRSLKENRRARRSSGSIFLAIDASIAKITTSGRKRSQTLRRFCAASSS